MRYLFIVFSIPLLIFQCTENLEKMEGVVMNEQIKSELQTVSKAKIFFGHQSVGYNILQGLQSLNTQAGAPLNILEIDKDVRLPDAFFGHSKIGINEKPRLKCDAFIQILETSFADSLDIAFFKFCYIDINKETNIKKLFEYYKSTMSIIQEKYPNLKFIYVTVPLRLVQSGWKAKLKKLLGKEIGGYAENIKRNQFNEMLRAEYSNKPIFDLAKVESTYPDGTRQTFEKNGQKYYAMVPAYTSDGGHLNKLGSELAAKELIHLLAKVYDKLK